MGFLLFPSFQAGYVVEGILKLILARPLGAPSLLQRFMSFVINSEIDKIKKESQKPLEKEIDDKILLDKLNNYVSKGDRNLTKKMAALSQKNGDDILTTILLYFEPQSLDQSKQEEIKEMQTAFAKSDYRLKVDLAYPEASEIGKANLKKNLRGSSDKKARKFAQLKLYLRSALRLRDHRQALKVSKTFESEQSRHEQPSHALSRALFFSLNLSRSLLELWLS